MFISNRDIKLEVLFDKKANCECLQWKFGYKDSKEAKEKYVRSKKSLLDGLLYPNNKAGERLAKKERAAAIVEFEKGYKYNEFSDLKETTFEEYAEIYLNYRSKGGDKVTANTLITYRTAFKKFEELNKIKMKDITLVRVESIAYSALNERSKVTTVKYYLKLLHCMFKRTYDKHKIIEPINLYEIKFKDEIKKAKEALTIEESEIVLEKFKTARNKQYYLLIYLALKCGMRIGEVLGLTWSNIDLENQTITIKTQFKNVGIEGSTKRFFAYSEILKTQHSVREIFISKKIVQALKEHKLITPPKPEVNILNEKREVISTEESLFTFTKPAATGTMVGEMLTEYGFPNISIHNLRHTFVTFAHQHGMDYDQIGSYVGDNPITVQKVYSHINGDGVKEIKRILEAYC